MGSFELLWDFLGFLGFLGFSGFSGSFGNSLWDLWGCFRDFQVFNMKNCNQLPFRQNCKGFSGFLGILEVSVRHRDAICRPHAPVRFSPC